MERHNAFLYFGLAFLTLLSPRTPLVAQGVSERGIFDGGSLTTGFDMGVNTSEGRTDWVEPDGDSMKMAYPSEQAWGAVFVTVGPPKDQPRPGIDLSAYSTLLVEIRGDPGTTFEIGIKDNTQLDDGNEAKVIVPLFSTYRTYAIPLSMFNRADTSRLYVVAEFVFSGPQAQTAWFRRIKFTSALAPSIDAVVSAASYAAGVGSGAWTAVYGRDLSQTSRAWVDEDFQEGKLPTVLDSVRINLNDRDMAVSYISPEQINTLLFQDVPAGQSYVSVTNPVGTSIPLRVVVRSEFPAFFTFEPEAGRYVAAVHLDGTLVGKPSLFGPTVLTRPAKPGDILQVYGTGFGPTNPIGDADELVSTPLPLADLSLVAIRVGDAPAFVEWGGLVLSGLYQFNLTVPEVTDGDHRVNADLAAVALQQEVYLTVHR